MRQAIGKVILDDACYPGEDFYCDGAIEDELLEIVTAYPESQFDQVIAERKDWAVLYHLSHIRWNIVDWLPITKKDKVLEVGAGCGAITGVLSDKAGSVTCIDLSKKRSTINATRNRDRDNIEILLGNFQDVEEGLTETYDWITLIGVFEYGQGYIDSATPYEDFLKQIKKHLAPGGKIVIAIENRLGLKYFAGCREDHTGRFFEGIEGYQDGGMVRTFSRPELEAIAKRAGITHTEFYYPYPDYKLPMAIYSDEFLPKPGDLNDNLRNFDRERYVLFDEEKAFDTILKDGLFPVFSNSYLMILEAQEEEKILFSKYSNERSRAFAIRTDICMDENGKRLVHKKACYPEGKRHLEQIPVWYEKLSEVYKGTGISMNRCTLTEEGIEPEFVSGQTLEEKLDALLLEGRTKETIHLLMQYIDAVKSAGNAQNFQVTEEFERVFGSVLLPSDLTCAEVTDIDMLTANVIVTEKGWVHTDYEWTFAFPIPVHFVVYRILMYYIEKNALRHELKKEELYERAGLTEQEVLQYEKMEAHFQQYLIGDHVPLRLLYEHISEGYLDFREEDKKRTRYQRGALAGADNPIELCVDSIEEAENVIYVEGWALNREQKTIAFTVNAGDGEKLTVESVTYLNRQDVNASFGIHARDYYCGFRIMCRYKDERKRKKQKSYILTASEGNNQASMTLRTDHLRMKNSRVGRKLLSFRSEKPRHEIRYRTPYETGLFGETGKFRQEEQRYEGFQKATALTKEECIRQKKLSKAGGRISILCVLDDPRPEYLKQMIRSIRQETYENWELCLTDMEKNQAVTGWIQTLSEKEKRIRVIKAKDISRTEAWNEGMKAASGEYVLILSAEDMLAEHALFEVMQAMKKEPQAELIYADNDHVDEKGEVFTDPVFKPDFNRYLLRSMDYIGGFVVIRKDFFEEVGGFDTAYKEAYLYDFLLRCSEKTEKICHIPKILCHERKSMLTAKKWDEQRRALTEHYSRCGILAEVTWGKRMGTCRTRWMVDGKPLVSVIIPNMDHTEDLKKCVQSVLARTTYEPYEILIVENNSKEQKTFACYEELKQMDRRIRILTWNGGFNYAAINNMAAKEAKGEYLVFLNNDTEIISRGWMEEMLGICQQPDVGVVGSKLFYPDGTIQHAGVILGLSGIAGHLFVGEPGEADGYMGKAVTMQNVSAVTAACMMTPKEVFMHAGGFDETLQVALNDVDYCLKVAKAEKSAVYTPYARLYHYESKSRGLEDTPEKKARYEQEVSYFKGKWQDILEKGDPYYSPNLSLTSYACAFRIP